MGNSTDGDHVLRATREDLGGARIHPVFVIVLAGLDIRIAVGFHALRRNVARSDVQFLLGELREGSGGQTQVAGQHVRRSVRDPVGDAESAELGEMPVVEDQQEMARAGPQVLQNVAVAAREIPGIAHTEIGDVGLPFRSDHGSAAAALDHVGPLRGERMPVQLADRARVQPHGNAGDALGNRELLDGGLLGRTAWADPVGLLLEIVLEVFELFDLFGFVLFFLRSGAGALQGEGRRGHA